MRSSYSKHQKHLIIQKLINTKAHLGYRTAYSDFQPYLSGFRNEMSIINLEITLTYLRRACNVIGLIVASKGHFLFVNTNPEYNKLVQQTATQSKQSYINHKWIGGLLTNWNCMQNVQQHFDFSSKQVFSPEQILTLAASQRLGVPSQKPKSFTALNIKPKVTRKDLGFRKSQIASTNKTVSCFQKRSKLEQQQRNRMLGSELRVTLLSFPRFKQMQKCFEGISSTFEHTLPDCIIVLNATQNYNVISEASKLQIPVISLVDSNISNKLHKKITYPIPTNENSLQFCYLFCNCVLKTILLEQKK